LLIKIEFVGKPPQAISTASSAKTAFSQDAEGLQMGAFSFFSAFLTCGSP
jgi:hypothetical protein